MRARVGVLVEEGEQLGVAAVDVEDAGRDVIN
jgi:hypothetical protein